MLKKIVLIFLFFFILFHNTIGNAIYAVDAYGSNEYQWEYLGRFDWSLPSHYQEIDYVNSNKPLRLKEYKDKYFYGWWEENEESLFEYKIGWGVIGQMENTISTITSSRESSTDYVIFDDKVYLITSELEDNVYRLFLYVFSLEGSIISKEKIEEPEGALRFQSIPNIGVNIINDELNIVYGGISNRAPYLFFERRSLEGKLVQSTEIYNFNSSANRSIVIPQFQFHRGNDSVTRVFFKDHESLILVEVDDEGNVGSKNIASVPHILGTSVTTYAYGDIGPQVVIDSMGNYHIVFTHHTSGPGLTGNLVMDVKYIKISYNGSIVSESILTNEWGIAHFPTINIDFDDNIYVAWEDSRNESMEGYFTKIDSEGNIKINQQRITWNRSYTKYPQIIPDNEGYLHAFWFTRLHRSNFVIDYRNNIEKPPSSLWINLGVNPYTSEKPYSQFLYLVIMSMLGSIIGVISSSVVILVILVILAVLNKIGILFLLQERPYTLFMLVILILWNFIPQQDSTYSVIDVWEGFEMGAGIIMLAVSVLVLKLGKLRPSSSMNILIGMIIWILGYHFVLSYPQMASIFVV
ncbi:hypothetical protein HYG86_03250 [Alkalicella caledoniensis]|uniref:Uncharacterized protein n=1 Tax=Alkalicella caledoniensis TaxID=2731377 RepID=A0A7G9W588_ALKCA|nr:hypothetical protein [Alkalicella caledoniensis]QNO13850.1 hypothetical protein HYG86_03250 [Alkalicella caledoniensis]